MKLTDITEGISKKPSLKPDKEQAELLAALLTVSNLGHVSKKFEVVDGKVNVKLDNVQRQEEVDLLNIEKYPIETRSIISLSVRAYGEVEDDDNGDYVVKEHKAWVQDVKRMTWEQIKKNWKDFGPIVATMVKAQADKAKVDAEEEST